MRPELSHMKSYRVENFCATVVEGQTFGFNYRGVYSDADLVHKYPFIKHFDELHGREASKNWDILFQWEDQIMEKFMEVV